MTGFKTDCSRRGSAAFGLQSTRTGRFRVHGYIAHVVDRAQEVDAKRREPPGKGRRRVIGVCHSWLNRFRKLLVRCEKLESPGG